MKPSQSCVGNSAVDSEGWWITCTAITEIINPGDVTFVMWRQPSWKLSTNTLTRNTTARAVHAKSVGKVSIELSPCYYTSTRSDVRCQMSDVRCQMSDTVINIQVVPWKIVDSKRYQVISDESYELNLMTGRSFPPRSGWSLVLVRIFLICLQNY